MSTLSLAICAHHSRKEMARKLSMELDAPVAMDEGDRGSVANHDAALRLAAEVSADWMVVIEDDAQPISDFRAQAAAALATAPAPIAGFYYGYVGSPDETIRALLIEKDPCWYIVQGLANAVCTAIRADFVEPLLHAATLVTEDLPSDHRWAEAAYGLGYRWLPHSYPSLVEHADTGSLIAGSTTGFARRAYKVGGREHWTGKCL